MRKEFKIKIRFNVTAIIVLVAEPHNNPAIDRTVYHATLYECDLRGGRGGYAFNDTYDKEYVTEKQFNAAVKRYQAKAI